MNGIISDYRIDIYDAHNLPKEQWESLLNELEARHIPEFMPKGQRIASVAAENGGMIATIYRTHDLRDEEVVMILKRYGIST